MLYNTLHNRTLRLALAVVGELITAAGINQTLHKIYIDVHAVVNIITPIDEPTITVKAEVLVAENLIVGDVPQFYFGGAVENGGFLDLTP